MKVHLDLPFLHSMSLWETHFHMKRKLKPLQHCSSLHYTDRFTSPIQGDLASHLELDCYPWLTALFINESIFETAPLNIAFENRSEKCRQDAGRIFQSSPKKTRRHKPLATVVFTWARVVGLHLDNSCEGIKLVGLEGDGGNVPPQCRGAILGGHLKGATLGVHEWQGDAGDTWNPPKKCQLKLKRVDYL